MVKDAFLLVEVNLVINEVRKIKLGREIFCTLRRGSWILVDVTCSSFFTSHAHPGGSSFTALKCEYVFRCASTHRGPP